MRDILSIWWGFSVRAFLALALAATLFFAQGFLRERLTEIIALPFVITALILYGIFDSLVVLVMSSSLRSAYKLRRLLALQGSFGIVISTLLAFFLFEKAELFWFVAIAFFQLGIVGVIELLAMVHLRRHFGSALLFSITGVASILSALALPSLYDENSYRLAYWLMGYGVVLFVSQMGAALVLRGGAQHIHHIAKGRAA